MRLAGTLHAATMVVDDGTLTTLLHLFVFNFLFTCVFSESITNFIDSSLVSSGEGGLWRLFFPVSQLQCRMALAL